MQQLSATTDERVSLRHVSKRYGTVEALKEVDFTVRRGEIVALLGPNGAGKTTAISIMLGLRPPTSGQARLLGLPPQDPRARSQCGVLLQESGVPLNLTVRELITLFRSYYPAPLPTSAVLAMADLAGKATTRAGALSGGQRQRLYFALAICGDPAVLFLDEPTAALDVEARQSFLQQVRGLAHSGKTIVFTTHYLEEVDVLAQRVIVINQGQVIADESPAALKARVAGKRVSFDVAQPLSAEVFAGLPVSRLMMAEGHVTLLSPQPELVLRALFARDVPMQQLEVVGATLEEAFLDLTTAKGA